MPIGAAEVAEVAPINRRSRARGYADKQSVSPQPPQPLIPGSNSARTYPLPAEWQVREIRRVLRVRSML